jgi:hypothetical protein
VEKTGLTSGPPMSAVGREKAPRTEGVNQRRKRTSAITPTTRMGRPVGFGLREKRGQWGPTGPKAEWAARSAEAKMKKKIFELEIGFWNLSRLWKFAQGDLGGILAWGFFLNSSKLLKDFRKI